MRREERVTVQGPVKEQQPDGMSHRGGGAQKPPLHNWFVRGCRGLQTGTSIIMLPFTLRTLVPTVSGAVTGA